MATLAEIREQFPQYEDMSDGQLADALYSKFYSDMDRDEFDRKVGLRPGWAQNPVGGAAYELANWGADNPDYQPSAVPWLDPISAFANKAVESVPVLGPALSGLGNQVDAAFNNALGFEEQTPEDRAVIDDAQQGRFPVAALAGQVAGTVAPLVAVGATPLGGQMLGVTGNLGQQVLMGGISGGALSAADSTARGGSSEDAMWAGIYGIGGGAAFPMAGHALSPVYRALMGQNASAGAKMLAPGLKSDGLTSREAIVRALMDLGPEARVADLGPNVQGMTGALATRPSNAQRQIVDALTERQFMGNARVRAGVYDILGPSPIPSYVQRDIRFGQAALHPAYLDALRGARAVDTEKLALTLDSMSVTARGNVQTQAQRIRDMLNVPGTNQLDRDPSVLLATRQAIDDMIQAAKGNNEIGFLSNIRGEVDALLTNAVPNIKQVDAQYQELARQSGALGYANGQTDSGRKILGSGPEAPVPQEVSDMMASGALPEGMFIGPSGQAFRFTQSARAELERIIGTNANDRVALQRILKGEGSWNYDRMVSTFGKEKTDALFALMSRERLMAETEALALSGSRTAPLTAAQKQLFDERQPGIARHAMNMNFGDATAKTLDAVAGGYFQQRRQKALSELADLLLSQSGNQRAQDDIARALSSHYHGILPPSSAPLVALPEPERKPLRVIVNGAGSYAGGQ